MSVMRRVSLLSDVDAIAPPPLRRRAIAPQIFGAGAALSAGLLALAGTGPALAGEAAVEMQRVHDTGAVIGKVLAVYRGSQFAHHDPLYNM